MSVLVPISIARGGSPASEATSKRTVGVVPPGDGKSLHPRFTGVRLKTDQWILGNLPFVHFQIGDRGGIGRPPVSREDFQLFGINPIEFAFADFFGAACGEGAFFAVGDGDQPDVVVAKKAYKLPVRRDFDIGASF